MGPQRSRKEIVDILNAFTVDLEPAISIAKRYGMTRQGVWKLLNRHGVETPKRSSLKVSCVACGEVMVRSKSHVRNRKNLFCSVACHFAYLEASQQGQYKYWGQGQRIARTEIGKYFQLEPGYIVHHIDRNTYNNSIHNLMVFACQGDHVRYHRLGAEYSRPLFDGRRIRKLR